MHTIDDKANSICLNHSSDWSGDVRVAWYVASERRECQCVGIDLIAGRFTLLAGSEPPVNVITRAVALAVEAYLRSKIERALDDLTIVRRNLSIPRKL
jgi:hypothetical protein